MYCFSETTVLLLDGLTKPVEKEPSVEEIAKIEELQSAQNKPLFDDPPTPPASDDDEDMSDDDGEGEEILTSFASFTD